MRPTTPTPPFGRLAAAALLALAPLLTLADGSRAQAPPPVRPLPIEFERSAEFRWLNKPVLERRTLDDMRNPDTWTFSGTGDLTFPGSTGPGGMSVLRVDMHMFHDEPAPTRNGLSAVNLQRRFAGEDWTGYNRLSMWIRAEVSGFPMLPLQIVLHNEGEVEVPDAYYREGIHYVTLSDETWQHVVWEIEPLARDEVTAIEIGYWVNKMLADRGDSVAFEIAGLELQRVEPDHYAGWNVAPGQIAFSHTGYQAGGSKTALASGLGARTFELVRVDDSPLGDVVLVKPVSTVDTRFGRYQVLDFSEVEEPGRYVIRAGDRVTRPFRIGPEVWDRTIRKALNFFSAERCGHAVEGSHGICHADWTATLGEKSIVMNGGWHDAGDLSQGAVNTGEAVYSLFALAERLKPRGGDPGLLRAVVDEAKWGLDWLLRVRFDGGYRIGFAGNNLWTNGILGDEDDRSREAQNNPNVNYIAAAAEAIAYRVLKDVDPELAERSLRTAEEDWAHAIVGTPGPETWATPAYAATPVELASIGVIASMELYAATGSRRYADKAIELARVVVESQQKSYVGSDYPLAGFFNTAPDGQFRLHQFHRGNEQAPIVAMARLIEAFPDHPDWMDWYAVVALYSEYQKAGARTTAPYDVLHAYVYHETDWFAIPEQAARHQATRESFRAQVREGMPMGDGYYLRAFPVWFARRGNFGVLLSQAKALAVAAHVRGDTAAAELAQRQAQWIVGRHPFAQSTMYGEGYDWAQQYSVSSGDIVGSLPVGMQSHGIRDVPYWPSQNTYVYKEVWVHPVSRWLWLMGDIAGPALIEGRVYGGGSEEVRLTETTSRRVVTVPTDATGAFRASVPAGSYVAEAAGRSARVTALAAGIHRVRLGTDAVQFTLEAEPGAAGEVTVRLTAAGEGSHTFELRSENLVVERPERTVRLNPGRTSRIEWTAAVLSPAAPWVAVVVADGDATRRSDLVGWAERTRRTGGALPPGQP